MRPTTHNVPAGWMYRRKSHGSPPTGGIASAAVRFVRDRVAAADRERAP